MTEFPSYDAIAERYRESKRLSFRQFVERHTLMTLLGDLRGRTVLDLACGEGIYARQFKRVGAAEVTGVDIAMLDPSQRGDPFWDDFLSEAPITAFSASRAQA